MPPTMKILPRFLLLPLFLCYFDACCSFNIHSGQNRRSFLLDITSKSAGPGAFLLINPQAVQAVAAPITLGETQNIGAQTLRKFRPKPPRILRQKLNLDFAVLLMRSSYAVTGTCTLGCEYSRIHLTINSFVPLVCR